MNQLGGRRGLQPVADLVPELREKPHVALDVFLVASLARGPDDEAFILPGQLLDDILQPLSFLLVLDLAGNGHVAGVGHEHQEPAGQGYVGGDAGALHSERILGNLHEDLLIRAELLFDAGPGLLGSGLERQLVVVPVDRRRQRRRGIDVRGMEERIFLQSDIHEGGLHSGQHAAHAPLVDVSDGALFLVALDEELGQPVVLHHGDAGFLGGGVDEDSSHASDRCGLAEMEKGVSTSVQTIRDSTRSGTPIMWRIGQLMRNGKLRSAGTRAPCV